jgi:hypothetical protein
VIHQSATQIPNKKTVPNRSLYIRCMFIHFDFYFYTEVTYIEITRLYIYTASTDDIYKSPVITTYKHHIPTIKHICYIDRSHDKIH